MKYLTALLLLPALLWGSKILNYNVYDRNDRTDLMLTFDTPYEGVLRQTHQGENIIIKLEGAFLESPKIKEVGSAHLQKLTIAPMGEQIEIIAQVPENVTMQASKTPDSYGLRLRFVASQSTAEPAAAQPIGQGSFSALPTKKGNEFEQSYYVVIAILVIGIAILFWLKQNIAKRTVTMQNNPKDPWLFSKPKEVKQPSPAPFAAVGDLGSGIHIRFQKSLDANNSVAMLDYGTQSYLVILGNNTLLLDKFQDNIPVSQNEFETLLQSKHRELDGFFQLASTQDEPFDSYKEKASGVY